MTRVPTISATDNAPPREVAFLVNFNDDSFATLISPPLSLSSVETMFFAILSSNLIAYKRFHA